MYRVISFIFVFLCLLLYGGLMTDGLYERVQLNNDGFKRLLAARHLYQRDAPNSSAVSQRRHHLSKSNGNLRHFLPRRPVIRRSEESRAPKVYWTANPSVSEGVPIIVGRARSPYVCCVPWKLSNVNYISMWLMHVYRVYSMYECMCIVYVYDMNIFCTNLPTQRQPAMTSQCATTIVSHQNETLANCSTHLIVIRWGGCCWTQYHSCSVHTGRIIVVYYYVLHVPKSNNAHFSLVIVKANNFTHCPHTHAQCDSKRDIVR